MCTEMDKNIPFGTCVHRGQCGMIYSAENEESLPGNRRSSCSFSSLEGEREQDHEAIITILEQIGWRPVEERRRVQPVGSQDALYMRILLSGCCLTCCPAILLGNKTGSWATK